MLLSEWNSIPDAIEWLTENTNEPWTWKNVVDLFAKSSPETVHVWVPSSTLLTQISPGNIREISFREPLILQLCDAQNFLSDISNCDDFVSASAHSNGMVGAFNSRFRTISPIPAAATRLSKREIHRLANCILYPFVKFVEQVKGGKYPEIIDMLNDREARSDSVTDPAMKTTSQSPPPPPDAPTMPARTENEDESARAGAQVDATDLPKLFDDVGHATLEKMFPSGNCQSWAKLAERACRNGLKDAARNGRGMFNPMQAAKWWLACQKPTGWDWARCLRVLARNLPIRSAHHSNLIDQSKES